MRIPATRRRTRAFTLIELIVVVIIIAVLAAIGAVAYNQFVGRAHQNATLASAAELRTAIAAEVAAEDRTPAATVDGLWTAAGGDTHAFLTSLGATYSGALTYAPSVSAGDPAQLQVAGQGSNHSACITLPDSISAPPALTPGVCAAGPATPTAPTSSTSSPAPTISYEQAVKADSPTMFYPMNDGAGSTTMQAVVGSNGTYTGGTLGSAPGPAGVGLGTALTLTGSRVGAQAAGPGSSWGLKTTVEFWYKGFAGAGNDIIGEPTQINYGTELGVGTSGQVGGRLYGGSIQNSAATNANDGNWHQIVVSADNSGATNLLAVYLDGVQLTTTGSVTSSTTRTGAPTQLTLGYSYYSAAPAGVEMADVSIYQAILTPAQVAAHYKAATG